MRNDFLRVKTTAENDDTLDQLLAAALYVIDRQDHQFSENVALAKEHLSYLLDQFDDLYSQSGTLGFI